MSPWILSMWQSFYCTPNNLIGCCQMLFLKRDQRRIIRKTSWKVSGSSSPPCAVIVFIHGLKVLLVASESVIHFSVHTELQSEAPAVEFGCFKCLCVAISCKAELVQSSSCPVICPPAVPADSVIRNRLFLSEHLPAWETLPSCVRCPETSVVFLLLSE